MAELKYIPFYPGYMEDTSDLSDGEFRRLMYALCAFCTGAETPEPLSGKEVIAYRFIIRNIKASQEQYIAKCKTNSENAKKRTQATANERNRPQANGCGTSQYKEQRTNTNIIPAATAHAPARESLYDSDFAACYQHYEQNCGTAPRYISERITAALQKFPSDLICQAIDEAAAANARNWQYISRILERCEQQGIYTVDAYLGQKEAHKQKSTAPRQSGRKSAQETLREIAKGGIGNDLPADSGLAFAGHELLG